MTSLNELTNTHRPSKSKRRVGRGSGSGHGKTSGRGQKGAGARSVYKRRLTYEGGQFRLFMKLPIRGFSNHRFSTRYHVINIGMLDKMFEDGATISEQVLRERGYVTGKSAGVKLLGQGELTKKFTIQVQAASQSAQDKVQASGGTIEITGPNKGT